MTKDLKEIADRYCGVDEDGYLDPYAEHLKEVIRAAYTAATTGPTVSRAYEVQRILENEMAAWAPISTDETGTPTEFVDTEWKCES